MGRMRSGPIEKVTKDFLFSKTYLIDFKNSSGLWATSGRLDGKNMQTRAFSIWQSIRQRTREGGTYQRKWPAYRGTSMSEIWKDDFQSFAGWYTAQIGYEEGWDVDKDALSDTRQYGPDTCILLPREINQLFSKRNQVFFITDCRTRKGENYVKTINGDVFANRPQAVLHMANNRITRIKELQEKYLGKIPAFIFEKLLAVDYVSFNSPADSVVISS